MKKQKIVNNNKNKKTLSEASKFGRESSSQKESDCKDLQLCFQERDPVQRQLENI